MIFENWGFPMNPCETGAVLENIPIIREREIL